MKFVALASLLAASSWLLDAQPRPKSQAEVTALQAMMGATDPDTRIKAAQDVLTNFANTEFKGFILFNIADAYNRKGDYAKAVTYGEQAIAADPQNYQAMLLLSTTIANHVKENDFDKEDRLKDADKYANTALTAIAGAPKMNPGITDDQWAAAKKDYSADAHQALGIAAMARKNYAGAVTEFKTAVDTASQPDPATMVRLGQAYDKAGKYDEGIATLDKVLSLPEVNPAVKQFAQNEKASATKMKAGAAK